MSLTPLNPFSIQNNFLMYKDFQVRTINSLSIRKLLELELIQLHFNRIENYDIIYDIEVLRYDLIENLDYLDILKESTQDYVLL